MFKMTGLRLSPNEALRHPFLAPECTVGFMLPPGYMTQGMLSSHWRYSTGAQLTSQGSK
jgi:hypothetical protein